MPNQPNFQECYPLLDRGDGKIGVSYPAFIDLQGGTFSFIGLQVYEDGLINCWENVSLAGFQEKLNGGRVSACPPVGSTISVHHLGRFELDQVEWSYDADSFSGRVSQLIAHMNSQMEGLYQADRKEGDRGLSMGIMGGSPFRETKSELGSKKVQGRTHGVFARWEGRWYLTQLVLYEDATVQILGLPTPIEMTLDGLAAAFEDESLSCDPGPEYWIRVFGLGRFKYVDNYTISSDALVAELYENHRRLKGTPTLSQLCADAYERHMANPSEQNREALRKAYHAVPGHLQVYILGDMDAKDWPIKAAIGED